MIQEPEGFELRDRRSDKSRSAADWTPADALFAAYQKMAAVPPGEEPTCLFVAWKDAAGVSRWRASGTIEQLDSLLLRAMMDRRGDE